MTPGQRHIGNAPALPADRTRVYEAARARNPRRWSRGVRQRTTRNMSGSILHPSAHYRKRRWHEKSNTDLRDNYLDSGPIFTFLYLQYIH